MALTVYSGRDRRARRRELAFLPGLWLGRIAHSVRCRLRAWNSRNHDRAYLANLTSAELEHLSRDVARPIAELQAEAKPLRSLMAREG